MSRLPFAQDRQAFERGSERVPGGQEERDEEDRGEDECLSWPPALAGRGRDNHRDAWGSLARTEVGRVAAAALYRDLCGLRLREKLRPLGGRRIDGPRIARAPRPLLAQVEGYGDTLCRVAPFIVRRSTRLRLRAELPARAAGVGGGRRPAGRRPRTLQCRPAQGKSFFLNDMPVTTPSAWGFYGRRDELDRLQEILRRKRWFFLKISGRRRIGKTSLVQQALQAEGRDKVLYIQVPDSDPAGVVSAARDFYALFGVEGPLPVDLRSLASSIGALARRGFVVAVDEFQYFHRKALFEFTSHLQLEVDGLVRDAANVHGGLIVLGSIHTEMAALLEDRSAPLFARLTHDIDLPHLDIASVLEMLRAHSDATAERLLFLWNLFEGVPKFYRDAYEEDVLGAERDELLRELFFSSSSPLRSEAENWFLRELRGRYDLVLKFIARRPGCTNGEIIAHARSVEVDRDKQVGGYLKVLRERYRMVEQLQPVFAKPTARNGRYYVSDNFLRSWLAALAAPAASVNFRPLDDLVREADGRLVEAEGHGLERLAGTLYEERSRKGLAGFRLTRRVQGFWDRGDTEVDLVALNDDERTVRLGTCKRTAERLTAHYARFDGHVAQFLEHARHLQGWRVEKVAVTTRHSPRTRRAAARAGYVAEDLDDLTSGM
jgi:uncharacterized protein